MSRLAGRREVLTGLALTPAALAWPGPRAKGTDLPASLARAAARSGRYFGAAARIDQLRAEEALRRTFLRDCAWVTPEVHMKWDALAPSPHQFAFEAADGLASFAKDHGLKLRGHALLWDPSTPVWAKSALAEGRDWAVVSRHFAAVVGRYREQVDTWDVVNEPIDAGAGPRSLKPNVFFQAFGPDYIARALQEARRHAPRARLAINEYGFDYDNPVERRRRAAFLRLLHDLKSRGAPLDAVGLQAHLDLGKGPLKAEIISPFLQRIADLGLKIAITELDVRERDFRLPLAERDRRVAEEVRAYLDIVLAHPAVEGVTTWGLTDRLSWLQDQETAARGDHNRGLPYDGQFRPKPMYWALRAALAGAVA